MVDEVRLSRIPYELVGECWSEIQPILTRALEAAQEYDLESVLRGLSDGGFQLWAVLDDNNRIESVAFTTIQQYPRKKVCTLVAGAGAGLRKWRKAFDIIDAWSIEQGCDAFRVIGRRGWARQLKDMKITGIILEKTHG